MELPIFLFFDLRKLTLVKRWSRVEGTSRDGDGIEKVLYAVLRTGKSFWQTGNRNDDDNPHRQINRRVDTLTLTDRVAYRTTVTPQDSGMVPVTVRHRQPSRTTHPLE